MTRALIVAAGTGGHVFPALAVAKGLQLQGWQIDWLGTEEGRLESTVVPANDIPLHKITMSGVRGHGLGRLAKAPFVLAGAINQCRKLLKQLKPDVVVTFGGYVCAPMGIATKLAGIPLLVHEQNAVPGMTTRLLAPLANTVMLGLPLTKRTIAKAVVVGNPVRSEILTFAEQTTSASESQQPPHLLVVGGSLGAKALNDTVPKAVAELTATLTVTHQCGKGNRDAVLEAYGEQTTGVEVVEFIDDMAAAYHAADLVICRAGALTVAELAALGKAAIFVPLPHAVDDHQTENARVLEQHGAAVLMPQAQLTVANLVKQLQSLLQAPEQLWKMARFARQSAQLDATDQVVQICKNTVAKKATG